jgi:hypothetical protein
MSFYANRRHDAEFGMIKTVDNFLTTQAAAITGLNLPIINTYHGQLTALISPIQATLALTKKPTYNVTISKKDARIMAIKMGVDIAIMVNRYAGDHVRPDMTKPASADNPTDYDMQTLMNFMAEYTGAFLYKVSDQFIIPFLENIWTEAKVAADAIPAATNPLFLLYGFEADNGVPADEDYEPGTLAQFETAIGIYDSLSVSPRDAIAARKTQNLKLKGLLGQADTILKALDDCFALRKSFTEIFNGYEAARIVIVQTFATQIVGTVLKVTNMQTQTTAVAVGAKIVVTGSSFLSKVGGQSVTITPTPIEVEIGNDGKFAIPTPKLKSLYTVKCTKDGYQEFTKTDIKIKKGDKLELNIVLLPVQSES